MEPSEYLGFCGLDNKLRVILDPNNVVTELDELNNEAVIVAVTVDGDPDNNCCSGLYYLFCMSRLALFCEKSCTSDGHIHSSNIITLVDNEKNSVDKVK